MKIRRSFVTNSSSSSFLIGKTDEYITKDIVFRMIRELYKEYFVKKEELMERCAEYHVHWNEEWASFDENDDYEGDIFELEDRLEEEFGINTWNHFHYDFGWKECDTYEEYLEYWDLLKANRAFPPFEIVDYTQGETDDCLCGENIFGWYIRCDGTWENQQEECEECELMFDDERCAEYRRGVREGKITNQNRVEMVLGKLCVESWEGYIPFYVADKLCELSRFACIHMG